MNKKIKNHLAYRWWIYLLSGVVVSTALISAYDILKQPKAYEKLSLTYIGSGFDNISLQEKLRNSKDEFLATHIKQITVESIAIENAYEFDTLLRSRIANGAELFLFEKTILDEYEVDIPSYFKDIDEEIFTTNFTDPILLDEKIYGTTPNDSSLLANYYKSDSSLELFFNVNSVNLSSLYGKGDNDTGVKFANYLLRTNNV